MKKGRPHIEFDLSLLEKLVDDESSCVNVQKLPHHIALHPFHLHNLGKSVKEILNADIAKYNTKWDGILCGYKNIKYVSHLGRIVDDSCYVHRDIEADFFIFRPEVGKTLQGIVNKMSKDHVGCLVHKFFNVTLPKPKHSSNWLGRSVSLNSEILLTVTETNFEGRLPFIKGEITSVLSNPDQDDSQFNSSLEGEENLSTMEKKLPKKIYFDDEEEVEESAESPKKKKSKKRKKSESEKESLPQSEFEEDPPHEKKSKRRKKSVSEKELLDEQESEHKEESIDTKESRKRKKSLTVEYEISEAPVKKKSKKSKKSDLLDYTEEENVLEFLRDE